MARVPAQFLRRTTADAVADWLRTEILRGEVQPGVRLRQNDVAERLGVSTTPVREAFAQLQAEGLLRIDPHRSAVVFRPTVEDLVGSYEIREALESLALAKAIPKLTDELLDELSEMLDEMRGLDDTRRWVELNNRFHLALYEASERSRLCQMIEKLRDSSGAYIYMFVAALSREERARLSDAEHREILEACRARDMRRAQRAVQKHLRNTADHVMSFLDSTGPSETRT